MKKRLIIISVIVIIGLIAGGCWWFLGRSNGLIPVEQIHALTLTKYDPHGDITVTITEIHQLRYLAGEINRLELKPAGVSAGLLPAYRLTFLDSNGQLLTQLAVYEGYLFSNKEGAYRVEYPVRSSVYHYFNDLANGKPIPVQNPEFGLIFLAWLGVLVIVFFCAGYCFIVQMLVCSHTDHLELRCVPILLTVVFCFACSMNTVLFFVSFVFMEAFGSPGFNPVLWILMPLCFGFHYLGWRVGDRIRQANAAH